MNVLEKIILADRKIIEDEPHPVDSTIITKKFLWACEQGKISDLKDMLAPGYPEYEKINFNFKNSVGYNGLQLACMNGWDTAVKVLLEHLKKNKIEIDLCDRNGKTLLHYAVENNHLAVARLLIQEKIIDINSIDRKGRVVFIIALSKNHVEMANILLENGSLQWNDQLACEALKMAITEGNSDIAQHLMDKKEFKNTFDNINFIELLFRSVRKNHMGIIKLLIQKIGDVDVRDEDGQTVLFNAVKEGYMGVTQFLIYKGIDVFASDNWGQSALCVAAQNGHLDIVKFLIENPIYTNATDVTTCDQEFALKVASQNGHLEVVKFLIENGGGKTDFFFVINGTKLEVSSLITFKLNGTSDDNVVLVINEKEDPLRICKMVLSNPCIDLLGIYYKKQPVHEALFAAAKNGYTEIVKLLLQKGINGNVKDRNGLTALFDAAKEGHTEICKLLLKYGMKFDSLSNFLIKNNVDLNARYDYVISNAAKNGQLNIKLMSKFQIGKVVDVNARDNYGQTVLIIAAQNGHSDVCKLFLDHEAKIDLADEDKMTPLHWAAKNNHLNVVQILQIYRAKTDLEDNYKRTPSQLAQFNGNEEVVNMIKEFNMETQK